MRTVLLFPFKKRKIVYRMIGPVLILVICTSFIYRNLHAVTDSHVYNNILKLVLPILPDIEYSIPDIHEPIKYVKPLSGTITSVFGQRDGTMHEGIDIAAPEGTYISAYMEGIVIFSGWYEGYGNLVVIDHGQGIKTYYGHNSILLVNKGQNVKMGQYIARVGSTGDSTGPHCHFEIRINGTPVNPLDYLE